MLFATRLLAVIFSLCFFSLGASAQANGSDEWLVTPHEAVLYQGEDAFNSPKPFRTRSLGPTIQVLQPLAVSDLKVKSPFPIAVLFKGLSDAPIDPSSFKVLYGTFKLDITDRITKHVKVGRDGFSFDQAKIPAGKHRLILQIQDEKKRLAERELKVEVE
jgi:hypothetical protein